MLHIFQIYSMLVTPIKKKISEQTNVLGSVKNSAMFVVDSGTYTTWPKQFKPLYLLVVVGSNVVVDTLSRYTLLYSMWDLKDPQMNVQRRLNLELILYMLELSHKAAEATKNIYCERSDNVASHITVTKWYKKFHSGCK